MKKFNTHLLLLLLFFASFTLISCSSDDDGPELPTDSGISEKIFVAGIVNGAAVVWNNGNTIYLTDGSKDAFAKDVIKDNGKLYVVGSERNSSNISIAKYWVDGVPNSLTNGVNDANALKIQKNGNDIYILVREYGRTIIFKNGVEFFTTPSDMFFDPVDFAFNGSDIYILGVDQFGNYSYLKVTNNSFDNFDLIDFKFATGIKFSGNDMYIYGSKNGSPRYMINNTIQDIEDDPSAHSYLKSMVIESGKIYATGETKKDGLEYQAAVWANNQVTILTDGLKNAYGYDIDRWQNKTYVVGYIGSDLEYMAMLWKDGESFVLANFGIANSIFIDK